MSEISNFEIQCEDCSKTFYAEVWAHCPIEVSVESMHLIFCKWCGSRKCSLVSNKQTLRTYHLVMTIVVRVICRLIAVILGIVVIRASPDFNPTWMYYLIAAAVIAWTLAENDK